jgi:uncharacterized protein with predicted RNA binding PUA domain
VRLNVVRDSRRQLVMLLDYLFGRGVSTALPRRGLRYEYSRRTKRLRRVYVADQLFCTIRPDGSPALTLFGASVLVRKRAFRPNCLVVQQGVEPFISEGRSVFCKHVIECGERIRPAAEVAVLDVHGQLLAVGRALLSAEMIRAFKVGVAVKVRHGRDQARAKA